ncbi:hypothetical protein PP577_17090 [Mycobacteroides abscessus]|nr:hypothetical protein [Mycobacteroides abscessus]MDM2425888.1 hypothetical protein [Mycobacteroides abscessus]MDM2431513.1 hypothetical protein [Mycobacteroides abscessus]MDM2436201.1 hypothetical protein [Mycobacteroides abscessus]MDM2440505.1 hypothetical protein [Mycobacteroides abscessus]
MTNCEPCALRAAGDDSTALEYETIRAFRLFQAFIHDSSRVADISAEIAGCQDCTGRLASIYLGISADLLLTRYGGDLQKAEAALDRAIIMGTRGL